MIWLGFVGLGLCASCLASAVIEVKANSRLSVTRGDDIKQLKLLASSVGREFEPNADTDAALKKVGIKAIRCINVDPLRGEFDASGKFIVGKPDNLIANLETCRAVGAQPHVIIATGLHPDLIVKDQDVQGRDPSIMGMIHSATFGPTDWARFQNYCEAYFEYVLITQNFPNATFEVGNEPDIGGVIYPFPPKPANGSRELYNAYFNLYKNVAEAADRFEKNHPGLRVRLGGPALAWAFTFRFGDFNWAERFAQDCGEQKVKLDFIGIHFYGNISSLNGEYPGAYPSFVSMFQTTKKARDKYCPGVPIWFTEWGPSYITDNSEPSAVNANHVGAAWSAAFLNTMLRCGVGRAFYLVATDLRRPKNGDWTVPVDDQNWEDVWGWPSMFVNPTMFGKAYPKAPFHLFDMISRMEGRRVKASDASETVDCIVSMDTAGKKMTMLIWNYGVQIPESGMPVEKAVTEDVDVRVMDAANLGKNVRIERWEISEDNSDAYSVFKKGTKLDATNTSLKKVESLTGSSKGGRLDVTFTMPPSSVSFVVVTRK
jgi:hypothetical protein